MHTHYFMKIFFIATCLATLPAHDAGAAYVATVNRFKAETFALGVQMGIESFQLVVRSGKTDGQTSGGTQSSDGATYVDPRVQLCTGGAHSNLASIRSLSEALARENVRNVDLNQLESADSCLAPNVAQFEAARTSASVTLSQQSSILAQAYNLGVNLGIAEAQATAGEQARKIVYATLQNAQPNVQALGLPMAPLTECISLAYGTTPMDTVHERLVTMRVSYQAELMH